MIEPQNSMLPLASEPRAADAPPEDSIGFGEMLAQSLGLAGQVDPNAVQQIATGAHHQHAAPEGEQDAPAAGSETPTEAAGLVKTDTPRHTTPPLTVTRPPGPVIDPQPVDGAEEPVPFEPVPGTQLPGPIDRRPIRTLPTPPTPVATPDKTEPVDGIWKPGLTAAPTGAVDGPSSEPTAEVPIPAKAVTPPVLGPEQQPNQPSLGPEPGVATPIATPGVNPRPRPPVETPPQVPSTPPGTVPDPEASDLVTAPTLPAAEVRPEPIERPRTGRRIPSPPAPNAVPVGEASGTVPAAPEQIVWPQAVRPPLVNLNPEPAVRLDAAPQPLASAVEEVVAQPLGQTATEVAVPSEAPVVATPASGVGSAPNPVQASALAERVMQAVDLQRTQPPPRSMVVDIPEVEGLRLVVSVRSGGQVSVSPASGSIPDAFTPFANDVSRVLAERGFVMTGDDRRRGHNPFADQDEAPPASRRPSFRRPGRVDNDLRI